MELENMTNIVPCENAFEIDENGFIVFTEYKFIEIDESTNKICVAWIGQDGEYFDYVRQTLNENTIQVSLGIFTNKTKCDSDFAFFDWFCMIYDSIGESITRGIHVASSVLKEYNKGEDEYCQYLRGLYNNLK